MPRNLMRLIIQSTMPARLVEIDGQDANSRSACYSYNCYSDEGRPVYLGYFDARSGGAQPVERGVSGLFTALPAHARSWPGVGGDEPRGASGDHRAFQAVGPKRSGAPGGTTPDPATESAADGGAGVHGADAMDAKTERVRLCPFALGHYERDVIVLFVRTKMLNFCQDSLRHLARRQVSMPFEGRKDALLAELVARGV